MVEERRIWVDGCFDFAHHGHAGALHQARKLGNELYVGVHSDEEIAANKGPVVIHMKERLMAVQGCRWTTKVIPNAPYVTDPKVMDEYGCQYVAHGDDITRDAAGNDCYSEVKEMGRFLEFKRTPNISTTDLIQRMLSLFKAHHLPSLSSADSGHFLLSPSAIERFRGYATAEDAVSPHAFVLTIMDLGTLRTLVPPSQTVAEKLAKKVFYVDGSFDLFYAGHIEFLAKVRKIADEVGAVVVAGIASDSVTNQARGDNYPIMNIFERGLCVLQCRYVDGIILNAPYAVTKGYLDLLRRKTSINVTKVFKGTAPILSERGAHIDQQDPYVEMKELGIFEKVPPGEFSNMRAETIVERVMSHRRIYEERQKRKGVVC